MFHIIRHQRNKHWNSTVPVHTIRMATAWNTDNTESWWGLAPRARSSGAGQSAEEHSHSGNQFGHFVQSQTYCTATMLLGIYPKDLKTDVHTETHMRMFIIALFVTAKTQNRLRCPSAGDCINKQCYVQTMECYSVLKRNGYQAMRRREKPWLHIAEWEKPVWTCYIDCDSKSTTLRKRPD